MLALQRVNEIRNVLPSPIHHRRTPKFRWLAAGIILVNPNGFDGNAFFSCTLYFPTRALRFRRIPANERDDPIASFDLRSAIGLPRRIPWIFHRHICEIERHVALLLRLKHQVVARELVLNREGYENPFILRHAPLSPVLGFWISRFRWSPAQRASTTSFPLNRRSGYNWACSLLVGGIRFRSPKIAMCK